MTGIRAPLSERFESKVVKNDGCWQWLGFVDKAGYARLRGEGSNSAVLYAHRLSYELYVGPIPDGLTIDHLCRNRACVNPAHLEPVTNAENLRRGVWTKKRGPTRQTHCGNGHERTPENAQYKRDGRYAFCKVCRRDTRRSGARRAVREAA
jgi:HNH endonuclease